MISKVKFPLYDQLLEESKKINLETIDAQKMSTAINNLPINKLEIVQALIIHHYLNTNKAGQDSKIPYGGMIFYSNKGIRYTISMLPAELKAILQAYLDY